jgi:hypothetical protein
MTATLPIGIDVMPRIKTNTEKEFTVLVSHTALLVEIYKYQLLTTEQLLVACNYSVKSLARVQRLMKQLVDQEYVLAFPRPVIKGKAPLVYSLAIKARNYLERAGYDINDYFRPSSEQEKGYLFLEHTLALNTVLISASRLSLSHPEYYLYIFQHERILKKTPYKATVEGMKNGTYTKETITLIPDAFLDFRHKKPSGKEERIPVLFELDRGTTEQKNFRRKIRAYITFLKSGAYKDMFGVNTITIAYGVSQDTQEKAQKRLVTLRDWTRKELAATSEPKWIAELFFLTALPQRVQPETLWIDTVWLPPFDEVKDKPHMLSLLAE